MLTDGAPRGVFMTLAFPLYHVNRQRDLSAPIRQFRSISGPKPLDNVAGPPFHKALTHSQRGYAGEQMIGMKLELSVYLDP